MKIDTEDFSNCYNFRNDINKVNDVSRKKKILINTIAGILKQTITVICGFIIMTARDNEAQVAKAKKRLVEIVIGIILWVLMAFIVNLLLPGGDSLL